MKMILMCMKMDVQVKDEDLFQYRGKRQLGNDLFRTLRVFLAPYSIQIDTVFFLHIKCIGPHRSAMRTCKYILNTYMRGPPSCIRMKSFLLAGKLKGKFVRKVCVTVRNSCCNVFTIIPVVPISQPSQLHGFPLTN